MGFAVTNCKAHLCLLLDNHIDREEGKMNFAVTLRLQNELCSKVNRKIEKEAKIEFAVKIT